MGRKVHHHCTIIAPSCCDSDCDSDCDGDSDNGSDGDSDSDSNCDSDGISILISSSPHLLISSSPRQMWLCAMGQEIVWKKATEPVTITAPSLHHHCSYSHE